MEMILTFPVFIWRSRKSVVFTFKSGRMLPNEYLGWYFLGVPLL